MNILKITLTLTLLSYYTYAKDLEKIKIQLDWLNQFQFAGYYMAKEKGFYEEAGLDVNIEEFNFDVNLVEDTLNTKNQYSVGKSSLIIDKLEGKDVVLLTAIYQSSPMVLLSLKKTNIPTVLNLKDKKVMLTPDARTAASINSMILSQGLKLKDINFQKHSFKLEDLISGKTDAMGSYLSNEPFLLKQKNIKYDIHNPSDYGFNFYGGLLFTSLKELKENPNRVKRVYEASLKGWEYAFENIEKTAQLIFDKYNTQNKSLEALIYEGKILKKLAKIDEGLLGNIDLERIEEMKRLYLLLGLSSNTTNINIDEFIYNPYNVHLSENEQNFLKKNYLTFLTNSNFPPHTMYKSDNLTGLEIDFWNLILKKLNIKSQIEIENNYNLINEKFQKNNNNIKYAYSKGDYNNSLTEVTNPIFNMKIGLATKVDSPFISDISTLNNKKIAIAKGSILNKTLKEKYPMIKFIDTKDLNESLELLSQGKVYATVAKIHALSYKITNEALTNLKISGTLEEKIEMKLLVHKENKILLNILNEAISKITEQERNIINTKYHTVIYETSKDFSWIYKFVLPLVLVIMFILFINRKLNKEITKRKKIEEELYKVANIDALTNISNRRKIEEIYNKELKRAKRYKRNLSIIFFDIDNFKKINDELGHSTGDMVLSKLSTVVKNNIRIADSFGRWGGEEFIIILPETSKDRAENIAYALKDKIEQSYFDIDRGITCSFGVAKLEETDSPDSLLTRVDHAMYFIKSNGKNGVKVA